MTGWKGYLNRTGWLCRNPLGGLAKTLSLDYNGTWSVKLIAGRDDISDKYARPGYYFILAYDPDVRVTGFEFYLVYPWTDSNCLRVRIGWKMLTRKFHDMGFAPLVNTITVWKKYGESVNDATI